MPKETFLAYWLGYEAGGLALADTPPGVQIVAIAFAVNDDGPFGETISTSYLTSKYTEKEIRDAVRVLQERNVRVVISINGKPDWQGHINGWYIKQPEIYARNVAVLVERWGLDGVDLDNEITTYNPDQNFVDVVFALRKFLGPDRLLTLPVYLGPERDAYLAHVRSQISFVSTMAYWNDFQGQTALFAQYAKLVGADKVVIGVANAANNGQNTAPGIVPELAGWDPAADYKAGIMLWNLNGAQPDETKHWCEMIAGNLS